MITTETTKVLENNTKSHPTKFLKASFLKKDNINFQTILVWEKWLEEKKIAS